MKTKSFPWAIVAAAAVAGAGFAGVASYVSHNENVRAAAQGQEEPGIVISKNEPAQNQGSKSTNEEKGTNSEQVRQTKTEALNKALTANKYGEFRVLNVSVEEGNAVVDMNKEILGGMGSGAEADFIDLLKKTLSQYDDVKTFQIRVDGEILKSLSHFEMLEPVPVR